MWLDRTTHACGAVHECPLYIPVRFHRLKQMALSPTHLKRQCNTNFFGMWEGVQGVWRAGMVATVLVVK